jgi:LysM repeat protein
MDTLEIENKVVDVLVNEEFTLDDVNPNANISLEIFADKVSILQNGNDMDVKLKLNLDIKSENIVDLNISDKIEADDLDISNLDSMNIYVVKPNDNLWSIAKKYNTTVDKIVQTNDITDQSIINVGQKILIIR